MNLTTTKWDRADQAYDKGIEAYLEFGQACARLNTDGTTQQEIGDRYQMTQTAVNYAIAVGREQRFISDTYKLPKSTYTLYLLTTLDDKAFEQFAKPDTTQADIKAFKEAQKPKKETPTPAPTPAPALVEAPKETPVKTTTGWPGWQDIAQSCGILKGTSGGARQKVRDQIEEIAPGAVKAEDTAAVTKACQIIKAGLKSPAEVAALEAEIKAQPEKVQARIERLVADRAFQIENAFWKRLNVEVKLAIARDLEKAKAAKEKYEALTQPVHGVMSKNDFRTVISCLASDKQPEDQRAKFDAAVAIFNKLKPLVRWD